MVESGALYLVTGGAGFIGSHLVENLVAGGARVRVLDDFSTGKRENLAPVAGCVEVVEGCLTDLDTVKRASEGAKYVFHQAALPSVARSVEDPLSTHAVDATGTLNVLVAAKDAGVRRLVYAGSSSAYGDTPVLPKEEGMASAPLSPYAVAKLAGEHYCTVFAQVMGLETVVLRYFNIFGPRQDPHSQYSAVIPLFIVYALEGRSPTIHGDGEQTRDFTYVGNAVHANFLACHSQEPQVVGFTNALYQSVMREPGGERSVVAFENAFADRGWQVVLAEGEKLTRDLVKRDGQHDLAPSWRPRGGELAYLAQVGTVR